jgi:hypothetical protein
MRPFLVALGMVLGSPSVFAVDVGLSAGLNFFGEDKNASVQELRLRSGSFWTPTPGLQFRLEGGVGRMESKGDSIWRLSAGPVVQLRPSGAGWVFDAGWRPTLLSERRFGEVDLGGKVQFDTHVGLRLDLGRSVTLGYRIHHLSNGDLYEHNPGINLQSLELGGRF